MSSHSSTANLVGVHYRVGKKIGEGSFGVIFEGVSLDSFLRYFRDANSVLVQRDKLIELANGRYQVCTSFHCKKFSVRSMPMYSADQ